MPIKTLPLHQNGHLMWPRDTVRVSDLTHGPMMLESLFCCSMCGEYAFAPRITDDGVYVKTPCAAPEGGYTATIRLNVPSGKLIVSNDLRPVYDGYDHAGFASYASRLGITQVVEEFGKQGCAFGFVGDCWPDLFQTGPDTYVLANPEYDEDADEPKVPDGWKKLADISGAVWSYSLADYEDWAARGGDVTDLEDASVVEVPAGVYEFVYHGGERGFDRHALGTVIFAHIVRI